MSIRPLFKFLALLASGGIVSVTLAADDSVWINQAIKSAISQGKSEYVLPAGTYELENSIYIPEGTKNFALRGAGVSQTLLTTPNKEIGPGVQVGDMVNAYNYYGISNLTNYRVSTVKEGATVLTVSTGQNLPTTGYHVLYDMNYVKTCKGTDQICNRAEIVNILSVNSVARTVTIDVPAGRDYNVTPRLADVRSKLCQNIAISDMGFDGNVLSGTASGGFVQANNTVGLSYQNLSCKNFQYGAVSTNLVRNAVIDNVSVADASSKVWGAGYGIQVTRSRFVELTNCNSTNCRHSYILHSGSMDVTFRNCYASTGFDTHGFDERRVTFDSCTGDGIWIGNEAWLAGAKDVLITKCSFTGPIGFEPNTRVVKVQDSQFGGVVLASVDAGTTAYVGTPTGGIPDQLYFYNCSIVADDNMIKLSPKFGTMTFDKCSIIGKTTFWGTPIILTSNKGVVNFSYCKIQVPAATASNWEPLMTISGGGKSLLVNVRSCSLATNGPRKIGISVDSAFLGKGLVAGCTFTSPVATNLLYDALKRLTSVKNVIEQSVMK